MAQGKTAVKRQKVSKDVKEKDVVEAPSKPKVAKKDLSPESISTKLAHSKLVNMINKDGCNKEYNNKISQLLTPEVAKCLEYKKRLASGKHVVEKTVTKDGEEKLVKESQELTKSMIREYNDYLQKHERAHKKFAEKELVLSRAKAKFSVDGTYLIHNLIENIVMDVIRDCAKECEKEKPKVVKEHLFEKSLEDEWYYPYLEATSFYSDKIKYVEGLKREDETQEAIKYVLESVSKMDLSKEGITDDKSDKFQEQLNKHVEKYRKQLFPTHTKPEVEKDETKFLCTPYITNCCKKVRAETSDKLNFNNNFKSYLGKLADEIVQKITAFLVVNLNQANSKSVSKVMVKRAINSLVVDKYVGQVVELYEDEELSKESLEKLRQHNRQKKEKDASAKPTSKEEWKSQGGKMAKVFKVKESLNMGGHSLDEVGITDEKPATKKKVK